jgi:basic membrane protein A
MQDFDKHLERVAHREMSRKDFLKGAAVLGATFTVAGPLLAACGGSEGSSAGTADKPLKAAFIANGEVGVGNFEITGYQAFQEMVAAYGMESEYAEATPYEQAPEVITDFANREFDLILAHSGGFQSAMLQVAPDFPDSWFVWTIDGDSTGGLPNCAIYAFSTAINFVSGAVAGMMTKTDKVGVVGAIPIPGIREEVAGFIDGALYTNPKVTSEVIWINSFMDASKAKEAALAMYGRGADVIGHVTDQASAGLFQAARDTGNWACGECFDEVKTNPDVVLTSGIFNESLTQNDLGKRLTEGTLQPTIYKGGWPEEWIIQGSYNEAIPDDIVAEAEKIVADLKSGKLVWDPRKVPAT